MSAFRLGFLVHVHRDGKDEEAVGRELSGLFTAAGELGFDGGWVVQHHLRADRGPAPLAFFSAVAERLPRIGLGTAMIVLPPEDSARLGEDAVVPALLPTGAGELGLGGISAGKEAFGVFGIPPAGRRELLDERLGALRSSLSSEPHALSASASKGRMWQSASQPGRAAEIGEVGDGLLLGAVAHDVYTVQRPLADAYLTTARRPRFGIVRALFPAKDKRTARNDLARAWATRRPDATGLSLEDRINSGNIHHGTSGEVIESLYTDPALLGYLNAESWFLPVVRHDPSDVDSYVERLGVIAAEIAPALGWRRA